MTEYEKAFGITVKQLNGSVFNAYRHVDMLNLLLHNHCTVRSVYNLYSHINF